VVKVVMEVLRDPVDTGVRVDRRVRVDHHVREVRGDRESRVGNLRVGLRRNSRRADDVGFG
jgi:hypothetical protein